MLSCAERHRLCSMKPGESEFEGLRLAAKAADRGKAAQQEWPAFEERLKELGYSPRAIAHAFRTLSGPGTVAEALEVLRGPIRESHPVGLTFEVAETRGGPSETSRVTITSVERDDSVIHVNYEIVPPPDLGSREARAQATDDLGNHYGTLGSHFGITADRGSRDRTHGVDRRGRGRLTMPLPPRPATMLRIRITWNASDATRMPWDPPARSIWERPAHEVRVSLPD
jgi:hypothetical protein